MRTKLVALALLLAVGVVAGTVGTAQSQAPASPTGERFTNYTAPTGPELSPQEAAAKAVQRVLDTEREGHPAAISGVIEVAHSTEAVAAAVQEGLAPADAQTVGSDAEQTEIHQAPAYLVVMHGQFALNVPKPPGKPGPRGTVLSMVVDAHTGWVVALQLGGETPKTSDLGPVTSVPVEATAVAARFVNPRSGVLSGSVTAGRKVGAHWRTTVRAAGFKRSKRTGAQGGFSYVLAPGRYRVSAFRPNGRLCASKVKTIGPRQRVYVALHCG